MEFSIKEFKEQYPNYNKRFNASNPLTKTEKIIGLRMHLVIDPCNNKEYQRFYLYDKYQALKEAIKDFKIHSFEMSVNNNTFNVIIKLDNRGIIKGICEETHERIMFCETKPEVIIPKIDESHSSDWFDFID